MSGGVGYHMEWWRKPVDLKTFLQMRENYLREEYFSKGSGDYWLPKDRREIRVRVPVERQTPNEADL